VSEKPFKIVEVHAYIATEADGTEGVIGKVLQVSGIPEPVFMPFIMADRARLESLRPHAEQIARLTGRPIVLARFSTRVDLEIVKPKKID